MSGLRISVFHKRLINYSKEKEKTTWTVPFIFKPFALIILRVISMYYNLEYNKRSNTQTQLNCVYLKPLHLKALAK